MAGTPKKTFTGRQVQDIGSRLKQLTPDDPLDRKHSSAQAVAALADAIVEAEASGVSLERIQKTLQDDGVKVGMAKLKSIVSNRRTAEGKKSSPAKKPLGQPPLRGKGPNDVRVGDAS